MSFQDLLNSASEECLTHLGERIFIKGVEVEAIFKDELFFDETGRYRQTIISINKRDSKLFSPGDFITARGREFKIKHVPDIEDSIIDLELTID